MYRESSWSPESQCCSAYGLDLTSMLGTLIILSVQIIHVTLRLAKLKRSLGREKS